jgi:hypothetical protein
MPSRSEVEPEATSVGALLIRVWREPGGGELRARLLGRSDAASERVEHEEYALGLTGILDATRGWLLGFLGSANP